MCTVPRSPQRSWAKLITLFALLIAAGSQRAALAQNTSMVGQWSPASHWGFAPVDMAVLPNGKVLSWDRIAHEPWAPDGWCEPSSTRVWDPATPEVLPVLLSSPGLTSCLFCGGYSFLPDGRLFVAGGHREWPRHGLPDLNIFNFRDNSWTRGPDMNGARWYPTVTTLPSGEMLVVSGEDNVIGSGPNKLPQVWEVNGGGGWRDLTGALLEVPNYPWMHVAPNGKVFCSGPGPVTRYLNPSGSGSWTDVGVTKFGDRGAIQETNYGTSVMYDDGKVLIAGGGPSYTNTPTATAEIIDLNAANPAWQYVAPMNYPRANLNSTLLPDGKVLVTGGSRNGNDLDQAVYPAEMWDPVSKTWSVMAATQKPRSYHSVAVLLPDARVLVGGGGRPSWSAADIQNNIEIYSPPYLFKGARPVINAAPSNVTYGQAFSVQTPNVTSIQKVNWVALSANTHSINMGQRMNRLTFTKGQSALRINAPTSRNLCPPGYYMLFILNSNGVPSVAKIIQISGTTPPAPQPAPIALRVDSGGEGHTSPTLGTFSADTNYTGGAMGTYSPREIAGTDDDALYLSAHYAEDVSRPFSYQLPASPGRYLLRLHFAECWWTEPGKRVCNVSVNGARVLTNFDISAVSNTAVVKEFPVTSSGGEVTISFESVVDVTTIAAIELLPFPQAPMGLTATASDAGVDLSWSASANATRYTVKRSLSSGGPYTAIATSVTSPSYTDAANLASGTTYYYVVSAVNAVGESPNSNEASANLAAPARAAIRIDCGGGGFTSPTLGTFAADTYFTGGLTGTYDTRDVAGTNDDPLYLSARYSQNVATRFSYNLPAEGNYTLRLHFAECWWTEPGKRVCNVSVNGARVLTNFDISAVSNTAVVKEFPVTSSGGEVTISFESVVDVTIVAAIELVPTP